MLLILMLNSVHCLCLVWSLLLILHCEHCEPKTCLIISAESGLRHSNCFIYLFLAVQSGGGRLFLSLVEPQFKPLLSRDLWNLKAEPSGLVCKGRLKGKSAASRFSGGPYNNSSPALWSSFFSLTTGWRRIHISAPTSEHPPPSCWTDGILMSGY